MKYFGGLLTLLWGITALALPLTIHTKSVDIDFSVSGAFDNAQREKGLMFVRHLPLKAGMLFLFPRRQILNFWMKNTYIPLDMIFFDKDGTIVHIAKKTVPLSLDNISSKTPAQGVLEIGGGLTDTLHIQTGDKVIFDKTLWDKAQ